MINEQTYNLLKENFGAVSSWAIWALPSNTPKSNTGDMSVFDDENLLKELNTGYVFVGLNASEVQNDNIVSWSCFHSTNPRQNDFKLRYALMGQEKYWGSYITDLIKNFTKTDSSEVVKYMKKHPEELEKHITAFLDEISLIGTPILVAMGNATYKLLKPLSKKGFVIKKIPHYAHRINKEIYREKVLAALET